MREIKVSGVIQLLNSEVRVISIHDVKYPVCDVFVPGQGAATVFLNSGASLDRVTGFTVAVFKNRLSVQPVYGEKVAEKA